MAMYFSVVKKLWGPTNRLKRARFAPRLRGSPVRSLSRMGRGKPTAGQIRLTLIDFDSF